MQLSPSLSHGPVQGSPFGAVNAVRGAAGKDTHTKSPPKDDVAGYSAPPDPVVQASRHGRPPLLLVGGDPRNLGDLALLAQNLGVARQEGRKAIVRTWGAMPATIVSQIRDWGGEPVDGSNLSALLAASRGADIIIGGGEMIRANTSLRALIWLWLAVRTARASGGSVSARGLGVSPVAGWHARLWRGILRPASHIAVRDNRSAGNLRRLLPGRPPIVAADMAFHGDGLRALTASASAGASPLAGAIIIAPCIDASEARGLDADALATVCRAAQGHFPDAPLVLVCHDERHGADSAAAQHLRQQTGLDATIFLPGGDLASLLAVYREAALVITNRLHAGIFAVLHERPLLVLDDGNAKLGILTETLGCPGTHAGNDAAMTKKVAEALTFDRESRATIRAALHAEAERNFAPHSVGIFAVKFSPNLGDGVIAECLEGELRRAVPGLVPLSIDLAGRTSFSRTHGSQRRRLLSLLEWLPQGLRRRLVPALLAPLLRLRHATRWRRQLRDCKGVVIGGGALFADVDQNFPIKLAQALDLAREHDLPVAVASVGVSPDWSTDGLQRVRSRLADARLVSTSVRDPDSRRRWNALFADTGVLPPRLAPDPGLLASTHYGAAARVIGEDRPCRIGLCITSPLALRLHGEEAHDDDHLTAWNRQLIEELSNTGSQIVLFTNGSPEDRTFRDELVERLEATDKIDIPPDFTDPGALVRCLSSLDALLAHRLHACIVAYSYRIPAIGLAWDRKLDAFFEQTGRSRFMLDTRERSPMHAAALALEALDDPPDEATHAALLDLARTEIRRLGQCLVAPRKELVR